MSEPTPNENALDDLISTLINSLETETPGTKEYSAMLKELTELFALKESCANLLLKIKDAELKTRETESSCRLKDVETEAKERMLTTPYWKRISPETAALVAGNILGIVLVLHFEKINVVTSKALGFIMKAK